MRIAIVFFAVSHVACTAFDEANEEVTPPTVEVLSGHAGVSDGVYIPTNPGDSTEAAVGVESILTNMMDFAREMTSTTRITVSMSTEATKAAAMVQILNSNLDMIQRTMIQLESIAQEEVKVFSGIGALVAAMESLIVNGSTVITPEGSQ